MKDEAHHKEETRLEATERVEQEALDHEAVPAKGTPPVTVIDAIMGAGKTHHAIGTMNSLYADAIYGDGINPRIDPPKWGTDIRARRSAILAPRRTRSRA